MYIDFFFKFFYYPDETLAYASFHCLSSEVTSSWKYRCIRKRLFDLILKNVEWIGK